MLLLWRVNARCEFFAILALLETVIVTALYFKTDTLLLPSWIHRTYVGRKLLRSWHAVQEHRISKLSPPVDERVRRVTLTGGQNNVVQSETPPIAGHDSSDGDYDLNGTESPDTTTDVLRPDSSAESPLPRLPGRLTKNRKSPQDDTTGTDGESDEPIEIRDGERAAAEGFTCQVRVELESPAVPLSPSSDVVDEELAPSFAPATVDPSLPALSTELPPIPSAVPLPASTGQTLALVPLHDLVKAGRIASHSKHMNEPTRRSLHLKFEHVWRLLDEDLSHDLSVDEMDDLVAVVLDTPRPLAVRLAHGLRREHCTHNQFVCVLHALVAALGNAWITPFLEKCENTHSHQSVLAGRQLFWRARAVQLDEYSRYVIPTLFFALLIEAFVSAGIKYDDLFLAYGV